MPWIDDAPNQPFPWGNQIVPLEEENIVAAAEQAIAEDSAAIAQRATCLHPCIHGNPLTGRPPRCCRCQKEITVSCEEDGDG